MNSKDSNNFSSRVRSTAGQYDFDFDVVSSAIANVITWMTTAAFAGLAVAIYQADHLSTLEYSASYLGAVLLATFVAIPVTWLDKLEDWPENEWSIRAIIPALVIILSLVIALTWVV